MFEIYDGRLSFYQWDIGEKVILNEPPAEGCQVHFQNTEGDTCFVVYPYMLDEKLVANVPNALLQIPEAFTVWCYVDGSDEKHTIVQDTFAVTPRQKPADYVYTETEVLTFSLKLDKNLGVENAGKVLVVGEDGFVECGTISGGGDSCNVGYLESLDIDNPIVFRDIESGLYLFYGTFIPYTGSTNKIAFPYKVLVNVVKSTQTSYLQLFFPMNNQLQYVVCTDSTYDRTNISMSGLQTQKITDSDGYFTTKTVEGALKETYEKVQNLTAADVGADSIGSAQSVESKLSEHKSDSVVHVTADEKLYWGAKSDFSGSYNDLNDKPTIPSAVTDEHINSLIDAKLGVIENGSY